MFKDNQAISNAMYFILVAIGIFTISFLVLYLLGIGPKSLVLDRTEVDTYWTGGYDLNIEYDGVRTRPDHIRIDKIGVNTVVNNPNTTDIAVLDQSLTTGAVHYPGSGTVEDGNMFIFGHSSGLPVVRNQAYKAFNGLEELVRGDEIEVSADGITYIYEVTSVKLLDENNALVSFDNSGRTLTLSTCNTFGAKQERWVVEANLKRQI